MMRCGSQRNRSARIALSCSSAKRRSSYIQSCSERAAARLRREHGDEADDVARKPGPQAGGDAPRARRASTGGRRSGRPRDRMSTPICASTAAIGSRSRGGGAGDLDFAAGDRRRRRPTMRPRCSRRAACAWRRAAAPAARCGWSTSPTPVDAARPSLTRNSQSSATCGSQAAWRISVAPRGLRRGQQRGFGAGHRRFEQIHRRAGQSVRRLEPMAGRSFDDARAHRDERVQVRRDRPARRKIAAGRREHRAARPAEQRAEQQHRSAQPADERRIRLGRPDVAARDAQRRSCPRLRPRRRAIAAARSSRPRRESAAHCESRRSRPSAGTPPAAAAPRSCCLRRRCGPTAGVRRQSPDQPCTLGAAAPLQQPTVELAQKHDFVPQLDAEPIAHGRARGLDRARGCRARSRCRRSRRSWRAWPRCTRRRCDGPSARRDRPARRPTAECRPARDRAPGPDSGTCSPALGSASGCVRLRYASDARAIARSASGVAGRDARNSAHTQNLAASAAAGSCRRQTPSRAPRPSTSSPVAADEPARRAPGRRCSGRRSARCRRSRRRRCPACPAHASSPASPRPIVQRTSPLIVTPASARTTIRRRLRDAVSRSRIDDTANARRRRRRRSSRRRAS